MTASASIDGVAARPCPKCGAADRYSWGRCKPCARASVRRWQAENPDKVAANAGATRLWKAENRDRVLAYSRAYYAENRDLLLAKEAEYRDANADLVRERNRGAVRRYVAAHPERKQAQRQRRRALEQGAATAEKINPIEIFERDRYLCLICMTPTLPYDKSTRFHPQSPTLDHVVPLSKGGRHARDNVTCAHRVCNTRKQARPWFECSAFFDVKPDRTAQKRSNK